jgi:hypothetical protein
MRAVLDNNETPQLEGGLDSFGIKEELWKLWERCWDRDVFTRPTADGVLECMARLCFEKP